MHVDRAKARHLEQALWQQLSIGGGDEQVRLQRLQFVEHRRLAHLFRLEHEQAVAPCSLLHRGRRQFAFAAFRAVRLGDDRHDLISMFDQCIQARHRKIGRAHK